MWSISFSKHGLFRCAAACRSTFSPSNVPVWDDSEWKSLPALESDVECDVCVVGLGGSGLNACLELRDLGQSVVGIDAGRVAGCAAGRNGGFLLAGLAPFHHDAVRELGRRRAVELYKLTMQEINYMLEFSPQTTRRTGSLRIALAEGELEDCKEMMSVMNEDKLPVKWYEGKEGQGLLFPDDAVCNPLHRCRGLADAALEDQVRLYENSAAVKISSSQVETAGGVVKCGAVVVAVDGRLEEVIPEVKGRVRTARLQMLASAPTDEVSLPMPVYARWGFEYWQQLPSGSVALGGYRDQGGEGEWTNCPEPSEAVQQRLEKHLREDVGVKKAEIVKRWGASVGMRESSLPLFEEVRPGVWVIGGYSGTGNVVGAICGRAAARMAVRGSDPVAQLFMDPI